MKKRLYNPQYVKEIMSHNKINMSKSLGQNFLIDGNIVRNIVEGAGIGEEDYVLEIGPGIGVLTEELALKAKKVLSVEIDQQFVGILSQTLEAQDNIEIYPGDILEVDLDRIIEEKLGGGPVKVVANLPYNITTPILARLLENSYNIDSITVMIQKEVADRIVSTEKDKDYGALSVFANFYANTEIILRVPNTVFIPRPKVESAVVQLKLKEDLPKVNKEIFFSLVKSAFGKRRKTILNSMTTGYLDLSKEELKGILEKLDLKENLRAENLSIENYAAISQEIEKLKV